MVNDPVLKVDALRRPLVEQHTIGTAPDPEVGGRFEYARFGIVSTFLQFLLEHRAPAGKSNSGGSEAPVRVM